MQTYFTVNTKEVSDLLNRVSGALTNFQEPFRKVAEFQVREVKNNFDTEGKNIPGPWKPLAAQTIAQRISMGYSAGPILNRTGSLRSSIRRQRLTNTELELGSDSRYFKFHQLGSRTAPQRQILGHSQPMIKSVTDIFAKYINDKINHG